MNRAIKNILIAIACGIVAGGLVMLLNGCNLVKHSSFGMAHDDRKFERIIKHDSVVVRVDSFHSDTVVMQGEDHYVDCDSVVRASLDAASVGAYKQKTVVKWKTGLETFVFDTVYQARDHYVENTARVALMQGQLQKASIAEAKVAKSGNMWRGIAIALFLLLLLTLLFRRK